MKYVDQLNRTIILEKTPQRVVSLVPSQSELLADLGLEDRLVGVTKFCIHPEDLRKKVTVVGGTKNFNLQKIKDLKPDLVIANKEENIKAEIEAVSEFCPVWISDIKDEVDALHMMSELSVILDVSSPHEELKEEFEKFKSKKNHLGSVVYMIWKEPYMTIGSDTFIHSMLDLCGFENMYKSDKRYPEVKVEELEKLQPDFILLSSEPYPFKEIHIQELKERLPNSNIRLVDGEMFSWYGTRMFKALKYFNQLVSSF